MATRNSTGFCDECNAQVMTSQPAANHVLHLLMTLFTCSMWIPIWFLCAAFPGPARCSRCGGKVSTGEINTAAGLLLIAMFFIGIPVVYFGFVANRNDKPAVAIPRHIPEPTLPVIEVENADPEPIATPVVARPSRQRPPPSSPSSTSPGLVTRLFAPSNKSSPAQPTPIPPAISVPLATVEPPSTPKPKPWQASRRFTVNGASIEGSLKTWSPSKVVLIRADGTELTTTRDAFSEADQAWVAEASKPK